MVLVLNQVLPPVLFLASMDSSLFPMLLLPIILIGELSEYSIYPNFDGRIDPNVDLSSADLGASPSSYPSGGPS